MQESEVTMTYQTNSAVRETVNTRFGNETGQSPQALPFQFGLRRRAMNYLVKRQANEEMDPAVGTHSTD